MEGPGLGLWPRCNRPKEMQDDEAGHDDLAFCCERKSPLSGFSEMVATRPFLTPTARWASSPVSGSTTRPPEITRSKWLRLIWPAREPVLLSPVLEDPWLPLRQVPAANAG